MDSEAVPISCYNRCNGKKMGYLGRIEIITKKVKKGVDKGGWVWYSIEAVRQDGGHN